MIFPQILYDHNFTPTVTGRVNIDKEFLRSSVTISSNAEIRVLIEDNIPASFISGMKELEDGLDLELDDAIDEAPPPAE